MASVAFPWGEPASTPVDNAHASSRGIAAPIAGETREVLPHQRPGRAGFSRAHILTPTIHPRDMAELDAMNAVWAAWMPEGSAPARTTVEAKLATPRLLVEITVTALRTTRS